MNLIITSIPRITSSKSKYFFILCLSFLLGVFLATFLRRPSDLFPYFIALSVTAALLIIFWKYSTPRFVLISLLCLTLGTGRFFIAFPADKNHITTLAGKTAHLTGYISSEPDVRTDGVRYVMIVQKDAESGKAINGKIYFRFDLYPRYGYGDRLAVTCKVAKPEPREPTPGERGFRYDMYLARFGVFAVCNYPSVKKIGEGEGNAVQNNLLDYKSAIAAQISRLWHEPYASFMAGLLYGYRGGLGKLQNDFSRTGVSHIVAVSGYNISVIGIFLLFIFIHLFWINRKRAFWLVVACIILFVVFTGMSASVVRAGIMGILVLTAGQIGRQSSPANLLMLAACLMVLQNPFILRWDAGFQLSFAATIGLAYLAPLGSSFLKNVSPLFGFKEIFIQTMSAIIMTLPLLLYQFGTWSIVAPIVNVLVVGLVPFLMIGGAATVVVSFVSVLAGKILSLILWAGLEYVVQVVRWFSSLPFATVEVEFPWWGVVFSYCLIFVVTQAFMPDGGVVRRTSGLKS